MGKAAEGYAVAYGGDDTFWDQKVAMQVAQVYEHTEPHGTARMKWACLVACECDLNIAVIFLKKTM